LEDIVFGKTPQAIGILLMELIVSIAIELVLITLA
jgi:hypothetical protein